MMMITTVTPMMTPVLQELVPAECMYGIRIVNRYSKTISVFLYNDKISSYTLFYVNMNFWPF